MPVTAIFGSRGPWPSSRQESILLIALFLSSGVFQTFWFSCSCMIQLCPSLVKITLSVIPFASHPSRYPLIRSSGPPLYYSSLLSYTRRKRITSITLIKLWLSSHYWHSLPLWGYSQLPSTSKPPKRTDYHRGFRNSPGPKVSDRC
jgi:hypothetical protein